MARVNPQFLKNVKEVGAFDISACYNCGNCTAICPLSKEGSEFPRKMIRYAILGLEDRLLSSLELWLCYYCGECTDSCPRDADPGGFMMAARRYAIQKYSWGKIAKVFYSKMAAAITLTLFTIFVIASFAIFHGPMYTDHVDIYSFISYDLIHGVGMLAGIFIGLSAVANLAIMYRYLKKQQRTKASIGKWIGRLINTIFREVLLQARFTECDRNRYLAHMSLFWGFVGLFIATSIHFITPWVDVILPRTIGIISGILLMYGSIYFIYKRLEGKDSFAKYSHFSDWLFLVLLFMTGLTGFLIDIFLYANMAMNTYIMYALHLLFIFDLLIIAPFTKFMHALYRPFAIWFDEVWNK